jgi:hypothetical protein
MLQTEESGAGPVSATRRESLLRLAGLCGLALSGDVLAAVGAAKTKVVPGLLTANTLALTAVLAELIIPATETPGALAVGAHHTISHMLKVCESTVRQEQFLAGLARIDAVAKEQGGKPFVKLPQVRQVALLRALDQAAAPFNDTDKQFFTQLKRYTLFAYYTSEAGATRELVYLPVPGGYKGNVPVRKNTRTWAL